MRRFVPYVTKLHIGTTVRLIINMFGLKPSYDDATEIVFLSLAILDAVSHQVSLQHGTPGTGNDFAFRGAEIEGAQCLFYQTALKGVIQ